ncbi:MAG: hypothetical protein HRT68_13960 [Flavobacteriaceae bacterium]|nr:hypothetical protein [Flavobacteriaceae bacterium]
MKTTITFFLMFLSLNLVLAQDDWKTIKDLEKGFRVDFPGESKPDMTDVPTEKGTVKMHTNTYTPAVSSDDKNAIYMTAYTQYSSEMFDNDLKNVEEKQEILTKAVSGAVTNTKGTLLRTDKLEFNGFQARESVIEISGGYVIQSFMVLADLRLYLLQAICKKEDINNDKYVKFIGSFELIKTAE